MKRLLPFITAASLFASGALADATPPLAPGRPAGGVRQAQSQDNTVFYVIGVGAIIAGIAIVASGNGNSGLNGGTPPNTSATGTQ